ncbi:hypothetical protein KM800_10840 [Clostridium tyrobutyricum]|uniref:hypothetical protein n=1 Tax=Clostridium tyrobutyricum TaxID=1519 RepID=UPI001C37ECA7|nr:hypothetical protein [Clostridium tyrobutyricum]MBV4419811.1 hypothetical protein [Clostridium tyrobutyricum]
MKKALGIIGTGLIAGAVVYVLLNKTKKPKDDAIAAPKEDSADISSGNSVSIINPNYVYGGSDEFGNVKSSTISTMFTRHEEVSKIMKDAGEIICKRSKIYKNKNRDLEQISDELYELLGEE